MSALWLLMRKELGQLARPQYILPWLVVPVLLVIMGQGIGSIADDAAEQPSVVLVDGDGDEYAAVAAETLENSADVSSLDSVPGDPGAYLRDHEASIMFVLPDGFSERIASGERGELQVHTAVPQISPGTSSVSGDAAALQSAVDDALTASLTGAGETALSPTTRQATTYVKDTRVDAPLSTLSNALSFRFFTFSFVIVFAIFGAGQLVISGMGSERENRTLETLLTMPIERRTIVTAKITSSAVVGVGLALVYAVAIVFSQPDLGGGSGVPQLTMVDYSFLFVSLAMAIVDMLAIGLLLGSFADDTKAAQTLLLPIGFAMMVPMFVVMYFDVSSLALPIQAVLYAIPSTHPVIAPQELLFGDLAVVLAGIAYETVLALVFLYAVVRLFASDRLVTGNAGRLGRVLGMLQR